MKKIIKDQQGFTMIELIVSISIIVALTIMFVANYHNNNQRTDLIMSSQNLVSNIHLAQNNALGLVKYNSIVPAGGWGVSLDATTNSYTVFADLQKPGTAGYMKYDSSTEGIVSDGARLVHLPAGIVISNIAIPGNSSLTSANVTFLPPDPETNIYNPATGATSTDLTIQLKATGDNSIRTIKVNFLGLAEALQP